MKNLEIRHSISRGRDTYGHNIVTLWDGRKAFRACGGGYDMVGTVFAQWLMHAHKDAICKLPPYGTGESEGFFGLFERDGRFWLNGACGIDCMKRIAKAAGLQVSMVYGKGGLKFIQVEENT